KRLFNFKFRFLFGKKRVVVSGDKESPCRSKRVKTQQPSPSGSRRVKPSCSFPHKTHENKNGDSEFCMKMCILRDNVARKVAYVEPRFQRTFC
uniref:Uncharacterized protein n=1 Tax=Megaselia scalaris TaxID=36166 RepID=T1H428_MEGSC